MRLERRSGLPQRRRAVDRGGGRTQPDPADIGQHVAGLVVEHHHRAIAHPARAQALKLVAQRFAGQRLHHGIERGGDLHSRRSEQMRGEVRGAGGVEAAEPAHARRAISERSQRRAIGRREQAAGPRGQHRRRCGGIAQQRCQQRRLAPVELVGDLAEERQRRRTHPLSLAAERCEVEIGLKDLVFAPAVFEAPRGAHLAQLVEPAASTRAPDLGPHERGGLHRDSRSPATARTLGAVVEQTRHCQPVDPAMAGKTVVLRRHDIALQFGTDRG